MKKKEKKILTTTIIYLDGVQSDGSNLGEGRGRGKGTGRGQGGRGRGRPKVQAITTNFLDSDSSQDVSFFFQSYIFMCVSKNRYLDRWINRYLIHHFHTSNPLFKKAPRYTPDTPSKMATEKSALQKSMEEAMLKFKVFIISCVCVCLYVYMYVYMFVCMCMCVCVCVYVWWGEWVIIVKFKKLN